MTDIHLTLRVPASPTSHPGPDRDTADTRAYPVAIDRPDVLGARGTDGLSPGDIRRLDALLEDAARLALTTTGSARLRDSLRTAAASTRRFNQVELEAEPDVAAVVMGAPRSGTSSTQLAIHRSGAATSIRVWESLAPFTSPRVAPRLRTMAARWCAERASHSPALHSLHPVSPDDPTEDLALGSVGFHEFALPEIALLARCLAAPHPADSSSADVLQQIRASAAAIDAIAAPRRWMIKRPQHVLWAEPLLSTSSGATAVLCVREPLATLSSIASFAAATLIGSVDPTCLDDHIDRAIALGIEAFDAAISLAETRPECVAIVRADRHQATDIAAALDRISGSSRSAPLHNSAAPVHEPLEPNRPDEDSDVAAAAVRLGRPGSVASRPFTYDASADEVTVLDRYVSTFWSATDAESIS